jgi:hypothetical protein
LPVLASEPKNWKKSTLPNGCPCEVPEEFNPERLPDGSLILRDGKGHIDSKMLPNSYYFDCVYHPLEKAKTIDEFNKVMRQRIPSQPDLTALKNRIKEQIDKIDAQSQPRNFIFLLAIITGPKWASLKG